MLGFKLLCVQVFAVVLTAAGAEPSWRTLLTKYQQWEGVYHYGGTDAKCILVVHSIDYVSFSSGQSSVDMKVSSNDNITVTFTTASVWTSSAHANGSTDLEFVGSFLNTGSNYYYMGNVSLNSKYSGTVYLGPSVSHGRSNSSTSLRYGLAIGIPLVLSILLMIASVLILRWGIKKGYLRHVPMAYKYFTNPNRGRAGFEMDNPEDPYKVEQPESHI